MYRKYRDEYLEVDIFYMSMSMSMGTIGPGGKHTILPSTQSPSSLPSIALEVPTSHPSASTSVVADQERLVRCTGPPSTDLYLLLEVELSAGKTEFIEDLTQALNYALSVSYQLCDARRSLMESSTGNDRGERQLIEEKGILISPISIKETGEECSVQSVLASSCNLALADFEAFGADAGDRVVSSIESVITKNDSFENELMLHGIVGIRIREINRGTNVDASNSSKTIRQANNMSSGQTTMALVLSAAAVTLIVAIILRRGAIRRRHLGYIPTEEEQYDDRYCLGISPREQLCSPDRAEHSSDVDTYNSTWIPFSTEASSVNDESHLNSKTSLD
mmetsp:Transcript_23669/g.41578  ORF Transcript_23669/g.41578 Transcript_23669/m.41578 type:complete len:335 (-) Transcript_23669:766-1770(-)